MIRGSSAGAAVKEGRHIGCSMIRGSSAGAAVKEGT